MINVWDYKDVNGKVKVTDIEGQEFVGIITDIVDVGEESEDFGFKEDSISIMCAQGYVGIPQSQIRSVEIL